MSDLHDQYEDTYSEDNPRFAEWRAICAIRKAENVLSVLGGSRVGTLVEIGCGDGAVLNALGGMHVADRLYGFEVAGSAVDRVNARGLDHVESVRQYDGDRIPSEDASYDVSLLSHVLEHVPDPSRLLAEAQRVGRIVVFEVPLEDTVLSHREAYRKEAARIGHIQKFSLSDARRLAVSTGLTVRAEKLSRKSRHDRLFWADTAKQRARGELILALTRTLDIVPAVSRKVLPVNYTVCLTA